MSFGQTKNEVSFFSLRTLIVHATVVMAVGLGSATALAGLCDDPLKDQKACLKMKTLKSQIDLLDAQRDLMQIDASYVEAVAGGIASTANDLVQQGGTVHGDTIQILEKKANELKAQAQNKDMKYLATANALAKNCLNCHQNTAPSSGVRWEEISANSWDKIVPRCNANTKNPFLCKNMHGMRTVYGYYLDSFMAGLENFEVTEKTAFELNRIAAVLDKNDIIHSGATVLDEVKANAKELASLAQAKDRAVFHKAFSFSQSCMKCHTTH